MNDAHPVFRQSLGVAIFGLLESRCFYFAVAAGGRQEISFITAWAQDRKGFLGVDAAALLAGACRRGWAVDLR